jgi:hypothetical protein
MVKQGLIVNVTHEHDFENELIWYRFIEQDSDKGKDIEVKNHKFAFFKLKILISLGSAFMAWCPSSSGW